MLDQDTVEPPPTLEEAYEALDSFDPALTKRALRVIVDAGDPAAIEKVLPLTQHADPALRFVAKRAVKELRALAPRRPRAAAPVPTEVLPMAVGAENTAVPATADPRLERLLQAPLRRREPKPRPGGVPLRWFDMEL